MLLRAQDGAGTRDADPADEGGGRESEVLHAVETDESTCAAEASLAVNSNSTTLILSRSQELRDNIIGRGGAISEEQIEMLDSLLCKLALLILGFVEADDQRDTESLPDRYVVIRGERAIPVRDIQRAREGDELAGHDPVEIAIFDLLEVLVLLNVKAVVVIPAEGNAVLEALETVQVSAPICAVAHGRIPVRNELVVVGAENSPCFFGRFLQADNHEGTHEEGGVTLLRVVERRVVVDLVVLILRVIHEFFQLFAEEVHFAEVERAEVRKEGLVDEVVVNAEVEGMLARLRRVLIANPIETTGDNFDGSVGVSVTLTITASSLCLDHFNSFNYS